ncbi:MAG: polysaccharide biosynthesis/export family protein [Acidobacteriota bacterium]
MKRFQSSIGSCQVALQAALFMTLLLSVTLAQEGGGRPSTSRIKSREDAPTAQTSKGPQVVIAADDDYRLAPSDVLEVIIEDAPELSGNYRINRSGTLPMKYLGSIQVAGKTTEDVMTMVTEGLRGRYLRDPKVYVTVKQYNSRTFFIQGAIKNPGVFVIEGRPSLFKLISIAGGMPENHGSTAYIIREKKVDPAKMERARAGLPVENDEKRPAVEAEEADQVGGARPTIPTPASRALEDAKSGVTAIDGETEYELLTANISGFYRGRFEQNLNIQPNDLVYIPPSEVFFVVGEVKSPGQFTLREGSSIRQAISLSQGLLFKAASDRAMIFRQDPATGKLSEIPVDIGAIMNGKKDDVLLAPNDVVMIPNSKMKAFAGSMMMSMGVAMAQTAILGIMR